MTIKYPCKKCENELVTIIYRGLTQCDVQCTECKHVMKVEKIRIKLLERNHD